MSLYAIVALQRGSVPLYALPRREHLRFYHLSDPESNPNIHFSGSLSRHFMRSAARHMESTPLYRVIVVATCAVPFFSSSMITCLYFPRCKSPESSLWDNRERARHTILYHTRSITNSRVTPALLLTLGHPRPQPPDVSLPSQHQYQGCSSPLKSRKVKSGTLIDLIFCFNQ